MNSVTSTPTPSVEDAPSESTPQNKKKPAAHTKDKVAAAQSIILLYTNQANDRKAASSETTRVGAYFKPDKVRRR